MLGAELYRIRRILFGGANIGGRPAQGRGPLPRCRWRAFARGAVQALHAGAALRGNGLATTWDGWRGRSAGADDCMLVVWSFRVEGF